MRSAFGASQHRPVHPAKHLDPIPLKTQTGYRARLACASLKLWTSAAEIEVEYNSRRRFSSSIRMASSCVEQGPGLQQLRASGQRQCRMQRNNRPRPQRRFYQIGPALRSCPQFLRADGLGQVRRFPQCFLLLEVGSLCGIEHPLA